MFSMHVSFHPFELQITTGNGEVLLSMRRQKGLKVQPEPQPAA
jgi:hypothetical protein